MVPKQIQRVVGAGHGVGAAGRVVNQEAVGVANWIGCADGVRTTIQVKLLAAAAISLGNNARVRGLLITLSPSLNGEGRVAAAGGAEIHAGRNTIHIAVVENRRAKLG